MPAAIAIPLITAGVGAAATAYTVYEKSSSARKARHKAEQQFLIRQEEARQEQARLEALAKGQRTEELEARLKKLQKARVARTRTLLTGGAGLFDEANIGRKRLLGE